MERTSKESQEIWVQILALDSNTHFGQSYDLFAHQVPLLVNKGLDGHSGPDSCKSQVLESP